MNKKVAKILLFKEFFYAGKFNSPRIKYFPFYPDSRKLFSQTKKLKIVADELAKVIRPMKPDLIASREAAGVPFGVAVALQLGTRFLYLRKKPKSYNTKKVIEGIYQKGQKIVVVDDAMSTGNDKKEIISTLEKAGLKVLGVVVVLDAYYGLKYRRKQAWLRQSKKYKFIDLVRWPDLMDFAADQGFLGREFCDVVKEMINDPLKWQTKSAHWQKFKTLALKEKNLIFDKSFKDI